MPPPAAFSKSESLGHFWISWIHRMSVVRLLVLASMYSGIVVTSYALGYFVRFEFAVPTEEWRVLFQSIWPIVTGQMLFLTLFGQFGALLSYFSLPDAKRICGATMCNSLLVLGFWYVNGGAMSPPRSVILMGFVISTVGLAGLRMAFRQLRWRPLTLRQEAIVQRVCIIGAGEVGAHLAKEMMMKSHMRMVPVAFFDDDKNKKGSRVHGVPILGAPELLAELRLNLSKAIIAMPTAPGKRTREVLHLINTAGLKSEIVPSLHQLVNGTVRVSQIRPVEITDLLGRVPVNLQTDRIRELVAGKVVVVTGAGGSIGSELCRQVASFAPQQLLLIERSEYLLFQIEQELIGLGLAAGIVPLVADIMDPERMAGIFQRYSPAIVFHAAAHKHVPMMEQQPAEAFRNNTLGTCQLAELSITHGVARFVMISTDKAINPTNVMGATKRLAELYLQALQATGKGLTKFMAVRFGNVLGSSGSVIPTFKQQIAAGGPVTVTHPDVTRYFMTVNEAVGLVLQSATMGESGEIFVLDMGEPMKIVDLARQLIELSGLEPDTDIEIKFTGLRPGEKLFEELNHNTENMTSTSHPKIMRFIGVPQPLGVLQAGLQTVKAVAATQDAVQVKLAIRQLVPEYQPQLAGSVRNTIAETMHPAGLTIPDKTNLVPVNNTAKGCA